MGNTSGIIAELDVLRTEFIKKNNVNLGIASQNINEEFLYSL